MSKGPRRDYHGKLGGRCVERTKNSAERGSGRRERKDDTFRVFSSLINSAHGPRSLSDAERGWGSDRAYKAPADLARKLAVL